MTRVWRRGRPEREHDVQAGLLAGTVAVLVGGATFYLARLLLARTPVDLEPPAGPEAPRDA